MRRQSGQAIVLIALMLTVLIGMAAIAIDGSRAYALRRDLQHALDSAALAASDKLQQTGSYSSAEQAAPAIFAANMRMYDSPSCAPGWAAPGLAGPVTIDCAYADGTRLTEVVSALGPQGTQFVLTGKRDLVLQFARILTNGTSPTLAASSTGGVNDLRYTPALAALSSGGCGGVGGTAISVAGSGTLTINGDMVSNGSITVSTGSVGVAGDIDAHCQSTVPGSVTTNCYPSGAGTPCSYPDVAGATRPGFRLTDPNYPAPALVAGAQGIPAGNVVLSPGSYAANPSISTAHCYFLSGGVYRWLGGYTQSAGFVSNELKPPDEPNTTDHTLVASQQFWNTNGVNCAGSTRITVTGGGGSSIGTWGLEVTSVRTDSYGGVSYIRESAPSVCRTFTATSLQTVTLDVSNVPGATSYYIYLASGGCAAQMGWAGSLPVSGTPEGDATSACPFGAGCSLGTSTISVLALILPALPPPNAGAAPGTSGAYPPNAELSPWEGDLPNQNPATAAGAAGDRANENNCESIGGVYASCPAPITPGAVAFTLPGSSCVSVANSADLYLFSGYQYNWIVLHQPSGCSNSIGAASNSAYIGLSYMPSSSLTIASQEVMETNGTGGILASTVSFSGSLPTIKYNAMYAPVPPASRLTG